MNSKERTVIVCVLALVATMVSFDIVSDMRNGVDRWHTAVEGLIALTALFGLFYVLKDSYRLKQKLLKQSEDYLALKADAERWRAESKKYVQGLSLAIDVQLTKWNLSKAEKEVAFLLLKGLSLKDIAAVRETSEKTARAQSIAIYSKAKLAGRSELAAFFLEDLLLPEQ